MMQRLVGWHKTIINPVIRSRISNGLMAFVVIGFMFSNATMASALSPSEQTEINGDSKYYDATPTAAECASTTPSGPLTGSDNAEKAFNYFTGKGLTPAQAAGIVGNFQQESGVNPNEPGGYLGQWGGGRLTALINYATKQGKPVTDLGVQLDYVWLELNGDYSGVLAHVRATTNYTDATVQFMGPTPDPQPGEPNEVSGGYENPGDPQTANRIKDAMGFFSLYGGAAAVAAAPAAGGSSTCSGTGGTGQNTQFIDGFTTYDQCDPTWGSKSYGDGNICADGCGPSSMAMIITNLTGKSVTPDVTAAYAQSHGLYVAGEGSSWSIAPDEAANWHLKSVPISSDVTSITKALQAGGLVIVAGEGPAPFTSGGHFIVIRGVTADGKWKVGDPDASHVGANTQEWDPAQLVTSMNKGSAYDITK
jgi:hypothetical protein